MEKISIEEVDEDSLFHFTEKDNLEIIEEERIKSAIG